LSIDEILTVFQHGFGIRKADQMRKEKENMQKEWKKENSVEAGHGGERYKAKETAHLEFGPEGQAKRGFNADRA